MEPVVVVGAGIAGLSCARAIGAAGIPVEVLDRGRKVGGRMASRRLEDRPTDLGAAFFTVSDPRFEVVVEGWRRKGLARPWTDTFTVLDAGAAPGSTTGPTRWGTPGGARSVVEDLAEGVVVRSEQVTAVNTTDDGGLLVTGSGSTRACAVVLAMPDPQARVLLGPGLAPAADRLDRSYEPVLALAAWWPRRSWDRVATSGHFDAAFINGDQELAWIADDGRRRGDDAAVLVAHSTPEFAVPYLLDPQAAAPAMIAAVRRILGVVEEPSGFYLQRWSVARPVGSRAEPFWLGEQNLGFCGDGWGPVSRVEGAFLSGLQLGEALVARLR